MPGPKSGVTSPICAVVKLELAVIKSKLGSVISLLWTVNFELSCMTSSLLDIHFLYTRVHVGFVVSSDCY